MKILFCFVVLANLIADALSFTLSNIELNAQPNQYSIQKVVSTLTSDFARFIKSAGDFNADGIEDFIVGANLDSPFSRYTAGVAYVIYGVAGGIPSDFQSLSWDTLELTRGFYVIGPTSKSYVGRSVSAAGDVNGDGIDDIIIGADGYNSNAGAAIIIYGRVGGMQSHIDLSTNLDLSQGLQIFGANPFDQLGTTVSSAGDVNGDGIDDVIIAALLASPFSRSGAGAAYVIYGRAGGFESHIALNNSLSLDQGFQIFGGTNSWQMSSVSSAGDVNADGIDDIIVGACGARPQNPDRINGGMAYIIYGQVGGCQGNIDLDTPLQLTQGFQVNGTDASYLGFSVAPAGDVNGDGIDDLILGASTSDLLGRQDAGAAYVIYGRVGYQDGIDLLNGLDLSRGFQIIGSTWYGQVGLSVSSLGDVNGDGVDDVILGSALNNYGSSHAMVYIVYGRIGGQKNIDLDDFDLSLGFTINGGSGYGYYDITVGYADINNDGLNDILLAARGEAAFYIIYSDCNTSNCSRCANYHTCQVCQSSFILNENGRCYDPQNQTRTPCGIYYANNTMTTDCKNVGNTCLENNFKYQNGSCLSVCSDPYSGVLRHGSAFCVAPCNTDEYLYPNGTCSTSCASDFTIREENNVKYCDFGIIVNPNNTNSTDNCMNGYYKYQDGSCQATCPSPYNAIWQNGTAFCNPPCAPGDYLYQNNSCLSDCPSGFISRIENNISYCDFDNQTSTPACNVFYHSNGTATTNCTDPTGICQPSYFLNSNGSCQLTCPVTYTIVNASCLFPCNNNEFLYQNGSCLSSCPSGFTPRVQDNFSFCDESNSTNNPEPPTNTTANVTLQIYIRYNISLIDFNSQDGLNKFIQQLAAILGIDPSYITIVDVREGSTIIESAVAVGSASDQASIDSTTIKVQAMSQKLSAAVKYNNINVIEGVDILDYKPSIQVNLPSRSDSTSLAQNSDSSNSGVIIGLGVALGALALSIFGYLGYRNLIRRRMKTVRNEPRTEKGDIYKIEVDIKQADPTEKGEGLKMNQNRQVKEEIVPSDDSQVFKGINLEKVTEIASRGNILEEKREQVNQSEIINMEKEVEIADHSSITIVYEQEKSVVEVADSLENQSEIRPIEKEKEIPVHQSLTIGYEQEKNIGGTVDRIDEESNEKPISLGELMNQKSKDLTI